MVLKLLLYLEDFERRLNDNGHRLKLSHATKPFLSRRSCEAKKTGMASEKAGKA
jgi:hypothetical protein